jgi:hypothetical protein
MNSVTSRRHIEPLQALRARLGAGILRIPRVGRMRFVLSVVSGGGGK